MHQIDGSNEAVARFFGRLSISYRSDTVYVFVIPPMIAARIEGAVNPFIRLLRKSGVAADIVVLAVYNKRRAAERYLQRRAFAGDHNLVTDEEFLNSFVFSAGSLQVPLVTKFCVSSGELLSSYSLLGATDSATVAWFVTDLSRPRMEGPADETPRTAPAERELREPVIARRTRLLDSDEFPLSASHYVSIAPSGSCLSLRDNLTNCIYVFDLTDGRRLSVLFPDSSEEEKFVSTDVPAAMRQWLKQNNVLNSMYFSHGFEDDTTLTITASLPKVVLEMVGADTNIGYHNEPVLIRKSILSNGPLNYALIQSLPDTVPGGFSHTDASFAPGSNLVFLPYHKGWPKGSRMLDDDTPPGENPFTDEFYQRDIHQFAAYNRGGEFVGFWGRMDERFEKLRLGYIAGGGLVRFCDGRYYLSDQHSGRIDCYGADGTLLGSVRVLAEPSPVVPAVDKRRDPLRYMVETFKLNFKARIVDFLIVRDSCYVLLLDEDQPFACRLSLDGNEIRRSALPIQLEGKEAKHYLLRETPSGVVTVSLLESPDGTDYCEFRIPDDF
jgi:hypothetical protein